MKLILLSLTLACVASCGVDAKVSPTIQVVPSEVLDAAQYCPNLPDAEHFVLVGKL